MERKKPAEVFIVEDDVDVRMQIAFLISAGNEFYCRLFACAEDALTSFAASRPAVAVVDIHLPGMDGIECVRRMKTQRPEIQILMCTVFSDPTKVFPALKAGASGYLLKSCIPDTLIPSLHELLAGGAPMSSQIARLVVSSFTETSEDKDAGLPMLTPRERSILVLLADGYGCREISEQLFVSVNTIRTHLYHIYDKLHVRNRVQAVNKFKSLGEEGRRSLN